MGAVFSMALPIALPDATGKLVEQKFRLQEWGYEGAIGGGAGRAATFQPAVPGPIPSRDFIFRA